MIRLDVDCIDCYELKFRDGIPVGINATFAGYGQAVRLHL